MAPGITTETFVLEPVSGAIVAPVAGGGWGSRYPGATPYDGGVPLYADGKIVGAVGVSGVLPQQDRQVANAAAILMN